MTLAGLNESKWVEYFGWKFGKITVAVPPHFTWQDCPACDKRVKKSLSTRTHVCDCGCTLPRDHASAIQILKKGLNTVGHTGIYAWGDTPSWAVGKAAFLHIVFLQKTRRVNLPL